MPGVKTDKTKITPFQRHWERELSDHVIDLQWSPTGKDLAAASVSGEIKIFSADGAAEMVLPGHDFGTTAIAWSADGQYFASAGQDGKIILWDIAARAPKHTMEGGASWVEHLAWNPLGGTKGCNHLLASAAGKKLRLWNEHGELKREYPDHISTISSIAWKPKAQELTSAAYSNLSFWMPGNEKPTRRFEWKGSILTVAWSPNGKFVATGDQDSTVHFWFEKTGKDLQMWGYPTKVRELAWSANSRYLATGGGADVTIWDCSSSPEGSKPITLRLHDDFVSALAFQKTTMYLASAGLDGRVLLWLPGKEKRPLAGIGSNAAISRLAWSPDDTRLAMSTESGFVTILSVP